MTGAGVTVEPNSDRECFLHICTNFQKKISNVEFWPKIPDNILSHKLWPKTYGS